MKFIFRAILLILAVSLAGCGGTSDYGDDVPTGSPPTVSAITPNSGKAGDAITITGFGFSDVAPNNIIIIGGAGVAAASYSLVNPPTATEIESITATVPVEAALGADSVVVLVGDNTSNTDVLFTILP